jgi:hypothetical protein
MTAKTQKGMSPVDRMFVTFTSAETRSVCLANNDHWDLLSSLARMDEHSRKKPIGSFTFTGMIDPVNI